MIRVFVSFVLLTLMAAAAALSPLPVRAEDSGACRIVYSENFGDDTYAKEYVIRKNGNGFEIQLAVGDTRRLIETGLDQSTIRERFWTTKSADRVDVERRGDELVFSGNVGDKEIKTTKSLDDEVWFGSVLLLKDFVLSNENEHYFYVTKPEETKAVLLKAIREDVETVTVKGEPVEAVRVKFTVPDIRGMFWRSYYWYRLEDGLLVKTEETRGGPGTPKAHVELADDSGCSDCLWLEKGCPGRAPLAQQ